MKSEESKEAKEKKGTISGLISFLVCMIILAAIAYFIYNRFKAEQDQAAINRNASEIKITQYRCGNILYIFLRCNNNIIVINHTADSLQFAKSQVPSDILPDQLFNAPHRDFSIFRISDQFKRSVNQLSFLNKSKPQ